MHRWRFIRAGGFDQVQLDTGADFMALSELDQKLWAALSCPTVGLEIDERTLQLIDSDKDGRIRPPELIAAARWAATLLKDPDDLVKGTDGLRLDAIDGSTDEGKTVLAAAKRMLKDLGKADAKALTVAEATEAGRIFAKQKWNGDGIVPADTADDPAIRKVIEDALACFPPLADKSGKPGVDQATVDKLFKEIEAHVAWHAKSEADTAILPLGAATESAFAALSAVRGKVDDFFSRCRLGAFDQRALPALNRPESEYVAIVAKDLSAAAAELASFPLARIEPGRALPLGPGINPAWSAAIERFRKDVVGPLGAKSDALSEAEWATVKQRFAPFEAWKASQGGPAVAKLGIGRVKEILAGPARGALAELIAKDKAIEKEAVPIESVERLARYERDLARLAHNYVTFRDFYGRRDKAIFQAGTLYLDRRSCDFCVRVEDAAKHSALAAMSRAYLAYCDCVRKSTGQKMTIVAAFTGGDADNLAVGRNGVFYDRQGRDYDATIVKIVENPISLREAFWSPYKKVAKLIEDQISAFASSREQAVQAQAGAGVSSMATTATAGAPTPAPAAPATPARQAFDIARFAGIFAAIGLAIGAIGGAFAALATAFVQLSWWQMPLALAGIPLVISGPSMLLAWLKLRRRALGPTLDANGWAVNANARINVAFGESLTRVAALPKGAVRSLDDPYPERRGRRRAIVAAILVVAAGLIAWRVGWLDRWLPAWAQRGETVGASAPAEDADQPPTPRAAP